MDLQTKMDESNPNSPEEVELIVSQPKQSLKDRQSSLSQSSLGLALEKGFGSQTTLSGTEYRPAMEELEEAITLSNMKRQNWAGGFTFLSCEYMTLRSEPVLR
ncbi:hypothetical protein D9C73_019770 [Collichthys lucidus]|uniref:Uncharacterized protein n=1 Tax=Collichthys lucidus TaxID=240159 RepID=A0A4V6AT17_COLLU|nr:hypothetical protein D9C73_019770 [Collichthys lucidus]